MPTIKGKSVSEASMNPPKAKWKIILIDLENNGAIIDQIEVETKSEAMMIIRRWNTRRNKAVCIMWPAWAPMPTIAI